MERYQSVMLNEGVSSWETWEGSDTAADFVAGIQSALEKRIAKELKYPGNEFNTAGIENIALAVKGNILTLDMIKSLNDDLVDKIVAEADFRLQAIKRSNASKAFKKSIVPALLNLLQL